MNPSEAPAYTGGFITPAEFVRLYSVSRATLYRAIKAGSISVCKVGSATRIPRAAAERWAAGLPTLTRRAA